MSKPTRPIDQINNSYFRKAAELGNLEWKLHKLPGQIEAAKRELKELDTEMDRAQADKAKADQLKAKAAVEASKSKSNGKVSESLEQATLASQSPA